MSYDLDAPDNGEGIGEVLYIHKDFRYSGSVLYTIDDVDGYYAIYNRGFTLSSADDRCHAAENEACDYAYSVLNGLLDGKVGYLQPTTWEDRWREKKASEEVNAGYNEILYYRLGTEED